MTTLPSIESAEQLLAAGDIGRCELVRGKLIMKSPASFEHGRITARLALLLGQFVVEHDLGDTTAAETGFIISRAPDTVRAPDLGLVRKQRLQPPPGSGFFPGAPDLAVEVLSPDDSTGEILAKVRDWLEAGTVEVWVVDPKYRRITIYRGRAADLKTTVFGESEVLLSEDLLPGFALEVARVFN